MSVVWNPWHGCKKISEGCRNCYVFRIDGDHGKSGAEVRVNSDYLLPLKKRRDGNWKIEAGGTVYTCFTSDFLLPEADAWRTDIWKMIRQRQDLRFVIFTKRIERLESQLPEDWGDGYPNITFGCTCENQDRADYRLPIFLRLPLTDRMIVCEPLLESVDLRRYLESGRIRTVTVGGESGPGARICDFGWVRRIFDACREAGVGFCYHQTGALLWKDGKQYRIPRAEQQSQAARAEAKMRKEKGDWYEEDP